MESINNDAFCRNYAQEKIRHSLQVAGAGNYLIRHISWLQNRPAEYIEMVQTAVLLHDICRFTEITCYYQGIKKYDHGVAGYEFLQYTPLFNDIRIRMPIKHHGHLIQQLYDDEEYQSLSADLRDEIQKIIFLVRDADKIANFNMITHEPRFLPLFFDIERELKTEDFLISDHIRQNAFNGGTIPYPFLTVADRATSFISWYQDINYRAAIDFCRKLNVTALMFELFDKYCADNDFKAKYTETVQNYINTHKFID